MADPKPVPVEQRPLPDALIALLVMLFRRRRLPWRKLLWFLLKPRATLAYKIDELIATHSSDYDLYLRLLDLVCSPYYAGASTILTREEQWIVHTGQYVCLSCGNGFDDQILNAGFNSFRIAVQALQVFGPPTFRDPALRAVELMRTHGILPEASSAQDDFWAVHDGSEGFRKQLQELALPLFRQPMRSLYDSAGRWVREHPELFRLPEREYEKPDS